MTGSHALKAGMTYIYARELMEGKHNNGDVSYTRAERPAARA